MTDRLHWSHPAYATTGGGLSLVLCERCRRHGDPTFVLRPLVRCIECGELCACNGCHAEQAGRATLDALDREQT